MGEFQVLMEEGWDTLQEGTGQGSSTRLLIPKSSLNAAVLPGCPSAVGGSPHELLRLGGGRTEIFPLSFLLRLSSSPLLDPLSGEWDLQQPFFGLRWEWEAAQLLLTTLDRRLPDFVKFLPIDAEDKTLHEKLFSVWTHPNQATTSRPSPGMSSLPLSWG